MVLLDRLPFSLEIQGGVLEVLDLVVDLQAVACSLQDEYPPRRIDVDRHWSAEPPLWFQIHSPARLEDVRIRLNICLRPGRNLLRVPYQRGDESTVRAKDLQPVVCQSVT